MRQVSPHWSVVWCGQEASELFDFTAERSDVFALFAHLDDLESIRT
jgi:hypothetical protein